MPVCRICKTSEAFTNKDTGVTWPICKDCYTTLQSEHKHHLLLLDSDRYEWGVLMWVHDTIGFNHVDDSAVAVGTWGTYGDGVLWVSFSKPIDALHDLLTNLYEVDHAERVAGSVIGRKPSKTPKADREVKKVIISTPPVRAPENDRFAALRRIISSNAAESNEDGDEPAKEAPKVDEEEEEEP